MKIKEQTRKLPQALLEYGKVKLTWFEEIFEEYKFYVKYDYSIALRNFRGKTLNICNK